MLTPNEIIKRAMAKAKKNGWTNPNDLTPGRFDIQREYFSHDFAKAFFGEIDFWKTTPCTCGGADFHLGGFDAHYLSCDRLKAERGYLFHLGKMVLEKDPIKYLGKLV